jgi:hypothetical protein
MPEPSGILLMVLQSRAVDDPDCPHAMNSMTTQMKGSCHVIDFSFIAIETNTALLRRCRRPCAADACMGG